MVGAAGDGLATEKDLGKGNGGGEFTDTWWAMKNKGVVQFAGLQGGSQQVDGTRLAQHILHDVMLTIWDDDAGRG